MLIDGRGSDACSTVKRGECGRNARIGAHKLKLRACGDVGAQVARGGLSGRVGIIVPQPPSSTAPATRSGARARREASPMREKRVSIFFKSMIP